ncbi:MAG TPA: hypothetical protein VIQ29_26115 [Ancylobacter sp.]
MRFGRNSFAASLHRDRRSYVLQLRVTDSRFAPSMAMNGHIAAHAAAIAPVRQRISGELGGQPMVLGASMALPAALSEYRSNAT